jgi:hypothetical protein
MSQLKDSAAKYAIVLGNDELAMLRAVDFFKIIELLTIHFFSSLSMQEPHPWSPHLFTKQTITPRETVMQNSGKTQAQAESPAGGRGFQPKGQRTLHRLCSSQCPEVL